MLPFERSACRKCDSIFSREWWCIRGTSCSSTYTNKSPVIWITEPAQATGHRPTTTTTSIPKQASGVCCRRLFSVREHLRYAIVSREGTAVCGLCATRTKATTGRTSIHLRKEETRFFLGLPFFFIPSPFHFRGFESWHIDMSAAVRHDNATNRLALDKHIAKKKRHGRGQSWWRHHSYGLHARKTKCISTAIYIEDFTIFDFTFTSIFYIRNLLCQLSLTE